LRTTHHNESSGRSDWFVLYRISLNDERSRADTSAIEPLRATLAWRAARSRQRGFCHEPWSVITANSFCMAVDEIAKTLIFRA
jgi:hypothetical protein